MQNWVDTRGTNITTKFDIDALHARASNYVASNQQLLFIYYLNATTVYKLNQAITFSSVILYQASSKQQEKQQINKFSTRSVQFHQNHTFSTRSNLESVAVLGQSLITQQQIKTYMKMKLKQSEILLRGYLVFVEKFSSKFFWGNGIK